MRTALVYYRPDSTLITPDAWERLQQLRRFARDHGYTIYGVRIVPYPLGSSTDTLRWADALKGVEEGLYDTVVFWHERADMPYRSHMPHLAG
jgi:hypothetical protein